MEVMDIPDDINDAEHVQPLIRTLNADDTGDFHNSRNNLDIGRDSKQIHNCDCTTVTCTNNLNHEPDDNREDTHEHTDVGTDNMETTVEKATAPDGGWGWCIVLGCIILRMATAGLARSRGLIYLQLRERFNESATATTWVLSLSGTIRLAIGPVVSVLCIRFSTRQLTSFGACFVFAGLLVSSFAPNMQFLYFSYGVLVGIGRAFTLTPVPIIIGYYFDKRRSLAYGLASTGAGLGALIISPAVQTMFESYGFRGTFLILSAMVAHIFIASSLFRPLETNKKVCKKRRQSQHVDCSESGHLAKSVNSCEEINKRRDYVAPHINQELHTNSNENGALNSLGAKPNDGLLSSKEEETVTPAVIYSNSSILPPTKSKRGCLRILCNKPKHTNTPTADTVQKLDPRKLKVSFSVLKDIRFVTYAIATFCLILPQSSLFLPALAKSRGLTDMHAAYILAIYAGSDTLSRLISGFVLDFKVFRKIRPLIYNGLIFMQVIILYLYPSMSSFSGFVTLAICDGAAAGAKNAQGSVVIVDILGIDKLASSMVFVMSFQLMGHLIGPTVSAQLKDIYGTYDGAFYFGGTAILVGGLVMAGGNVRKIWTDRRTKNSKFKNDNKCHRSTCTL